MNAEDEILKLVVLLKVVDDDSVLPRLVAADRPCMRQELRCVTEPLGCFIRRLSGLRDVLEHVSLERAGDNLSRAGSGVISRREQPG